MLELLPDRPATKAGATVKGKPRTYYRLTDGTVLHLDRVVCQGFPTRWDVLGWEPYWRRWRRYGTFTDSGSGRAAFWRIIRSEVN